MRKLGVDYGDARIGFAVSDPMGIIASPLSVYRRNRKNPAADIGYVAALAAEKEADTVVIGLPLNMDGAEGARAKKTRDFARALREVLPPSVKIDFWDERLSTVGAEDILIEAGVRRDMRRGLVDKIAAQIILKEYLER